MTVYKATYSGDAWLLAIVYNPGNEEPIDLNAAYGRTDVQDVHDWMFTVIDERGDDPQYYGVASSATTGPVLYVSTEKGLINEAMQADMEATR